VEEKREHLEPDAVFYYADEFNVSWQPTLKTMWSPVGQQVMIPTPGQPTRHYGIGAVDYHSGQTIVQIEKREKREQIAQLLEQLRGLFGKSPIAGLFSLLNRLKRL
jgi:hypothetical protein